MEATLLAIPSRSLKFSLPIVLLFCCQPFARSGAFDKSYDRLLIKQGFVPLPSPRSNFGVGTVIPLDKKKNIIMAGQEECFPGLENQIAEGEITLINSKNVRGLNLNASANYSPTGTTAFLSKLSGLFGYKSNVTMDVVFGDTKALSLTAVGLELYLKGHVINKVCAGRLKDPKNAVIFSMAKVTSLTYTFSGTKTANGSLDIAALKSLLNASGSLTYSNTTDNSLTISTPLYVGYNAFSLRSLSIQEEESSRSLPKIATIHVAKSNVRFPFAL